MPTDSQSPAQPSPAQPIHTSNISASYALIHLRNNPHRHIVRNPRPARRIRQTRNLNRTHETLTRERNLDREEHIHIIPRNRKLQRPRGIVRVNHIVMPAHHARIGIVLVLSIDGFDPGLVGRAQGEEDVDIRNDRVGPLQFKFHVDGHRTGALILRPAVDGERSGILPAVIPTQYADGTIDGIGLSALETEHAIFFVGLFVHLGMCREGPARTAFCAVGGLVDDNVGHGPGVGVGGVRDGALDFGRFDLPLA
mmetsp:Transcript_27769/g.50137  ORF Transcript_27769/g.50137 Transcript_27769/m.50137 type:complete len:253 (+) Transcript_27769:775-1533(+)